MLNQSCMKFIRMLLDSNYVTTPHFRFHWSLNPGWNVSISYQLDTKWLRQEIKAYEWRWVLFRYYFVLSARHVYQCFTNSEGLLVSDQSHIADLRPTYSIMGALDRENRRFSVCSLPESCMKVYESKLWLGFCGDVCCHCTEPCTGALTSIADWLVTQQCTSMLLPTLPCAAPTTFLVVSDKSTFFCFLLLSDNIQTIALRVRLPNNPWQENILKGAFYQKELPALS